MLNAQNISAADDTFTVGTGHSQQTNLMTWGDFVRGKMSVGEYFLMPLLFLGGGWHVGEGGFEKFGPGFFIFDRSSAKHALLLDVEFGLNLRRYAFGIKGHHLLTRSLTSMYSYGLHGRSGLCAVLFWSSSVGRIVSACVI